MSQDAAVVEYRKGRSRPQHFAMIYHELFDLYAQRIGGFAGVGYYAYLLRLVNHNSDHPYSERSFPTKRHLKDIGRLGADKIKELELLCVAWGLIEIRVTTRKVRGRNGNTVEARKFTYIVHDPLPRDDFEAAVAGRRLPISPSTLPPDLLPTWWSEETARKLGVPFAVPIQERRADLAVPNQEQRDTTLGVPAQEQPGRRSQLGTNKKTNGHSKKTNIITAPSTSLRGDARVLPGDDDDLSASHLTEPSELVAASREMAASSENNAGLTPSDPVAELRTAFLEAAGQELSVGQAREILRKWPLDYALAKLDVVRWQRTRPGGGFRSSARAYYLAALRGDYQVDTTEEERRRQAEEVERRRLEELRRAEEEARRREEMRAAIGQAILDRLSEDERAEIRGEAEARLLERVAGRREFLVAPMVEALMRQLALERYGEAAFRVAAPSEDTLPLTAGSDEDDHD